jgi:pimeloyl-ACP methyl ester carboxylesterase
METDMSEGSDKAVPFTIQIGDQVLHDLRERLKKTRFPEDFNNADWEYGFDTEYLRSLIGYWAGQYDWRKQEREMNKLPHFKTTIDGVLIHFVHMKGRGPHPKPLLLHHGWPWTFWDLKKVMAPLADPGAHGGDPADAFDVVLISLPGHGFSSPLRQPNINFWRTADLEVKLMNEVLGYDKFFTAGGDWGALIVAQLGHKYADRVLGVYTHLPIQLSHYLADHPDVPPGIAYSNGLPEPSVYGPGEESWVRTNKDFFDKESGYGYIHLTKPQTLGVGLNDSPAGLFAWIIEKRRTWADVSGNIESVFDRDHLCDTATIYWATQTITTAARFYKEVLHNPWRPSHRRFPVVEAPTFAFVHPKDVLLMPRAWAEKYHNLKGWEVMKSGGHFAPYELPNEFVGGIRKSFRTLR